MKFFKLPDLGEGLAEAEIVEWHVAVGEKVLVDQKLVSVETAKAIVEVPSPVTGIIIKRFGDVGEVVHIGEPLVEFEGDGEDSGTVVGQIKTASSQAEEDRFIIGAANAHSPSATQMRALPSVRAAAKRYGLDLNQIKGTGPQGQISLADVEQLREQQDHKGMLELLKGPRKAMAKAMAESHAQVVPVTLCDDADLHAWPKGEDLTMRLVHAIAAGCTAEPALNVWFNGEQQTRRLLNTIDLGVAVDSEQGLFVPVLRDIGNKNQKTLRADLERIRKGIKDRTIPPSEMVGATITLSNFGMIAGRYASPIVVPPTVAIVGAGRLKDEVVAVEGKPEVHKILPISLTFDHRAMTGGEAARFLRALLDDLQQATVK
jgi:2-oxoisovalerate dehydrogenase E2 component (dihydrolipoyl transacylase)